jgi:UDP-N-acetyl-D-galactosamine dehydrogenase
MNNTKIAVLGLGYVGLPLAVEFSAVYPVLGFDIKKDRVNALNGGEDATGEISQERLKSALQSTDAGKKLVCTFDESRLSEANFYIITVPTPTDKHNRPDLTPLIKASEMVGKYLKYGDTVVYESTVYPGVTEDECIPVLERVSGFTFNKDFFAGYSPERINPGDKQHTLTKILKITSGSTPEAAERIDKVYRTVITAGTYKAPSIRVAEAAKVIENSQRDINIAFVNELAKIFNRLNIDTEEVLKAAGTKWNFLGFKPGLVGGHCIGVDPYYLAQKAQEVGYHPEIILAGRRINDTMGVYVADEVIKLMVRKKIPVTGSEVLVLGFTFKENCPDVRNTRVIDIIRRLEEYHIKVCIHDPLANPQEVEHEYGVICQNGEVSGRKFNAVIAAVAHSEFDTLDVRSLCKENAVVYDIKGKLPPELCDGRL